MASQFLQAEQTLVADMLQAVKSAEARRAAIKAAAQHRLAASPDELRFFLAALEALSHAEGNRHRFAHHIWASSGDIPGAIILIDPALVERSVAAEAEGITEHGWRFAEAPHFDRMRVMVYRKQDLMEEVGEAADAASIMDGLEEWYAFVSDQEVSATIRDMLLEQYPRLRRAFDRAAPESP